MIGPGMCVVERGPVSEIGIECQTDGMESGQRG